LGHVNPIGSRSCYDEGMQALKNEPIAVYGDGKQTRSFCYVDDLIEGIVRLMATPDDFTGPVMTSSKSKVVFKTLPDDDPRQRQSDTSLARERCGWQPAVRLEDGLRKTVTYFETIVNEKYAT
jgi:UDP-glucuronate decarboxylase